MDGLLFPRLVSQALTDFVLQITGSLRSARRRRRCVADRGKRALLEIAGTIEIIQRPSLGPRRICAAIGTGIPCALVPFHFPTLARRADLSLTLERDLENIEQTRETDAGELCLSNARDRMSERIVLRGDIDRSPTDSPIVPSVNRRWRVCGAASFTI